MTRNPFLRSRTHVPVVLAAVVAAFVMVTAARPVHAEEFEERATFSGRELTVTSLVGAVQVEGFDGNEFEVVVNVRGKDASKDRIRIEKHTGGDARLDVVFPVKGESKFVYPALGNHSSTTVNVSRGESHVEGPLMTVLRSLGGRRVRVSGRGNGFEAWADIKIRVPRDRTLKVDLGVGSIAAGNVSAALDLRARSGPVTARDVTGNLSVDTGSGEVSVDGAHGDRLHVDTGSGQVQVSGATCRQLHVDTGSGQVIARGVVADDVNIDTGSGSVELDLDRVGSGSYRVDTGSGAIELRLPGDASAEVAAETGSGHIEIEAGTVNILSRDDDSIAFRMGDGAADIKVETGSGSILISN